MGTSGRFGKYGEQKRRERLASKRLAFRDSAGEKRTASKPKKRKKS